MYRMSVLALFLSLAGHAGLAADPPAGERPAQALPAHSTAAIDRYLREEMRRQGIPGISLAVV